MVQEQVEVLLIEDNPADADLVRGHLSAVAHTQFNLQWVELLAEGLQKIECGGIDVVLLDLGLPDSEGLDTFQAIHATSPRLPIIVLTGRDDEELALEAARRGAQDYLAKGQLDGGLLSRSIRYSIERKRAEEALRESEERFRELADMLPQMVFEIDENGAIAFLNQASFVTMGYTPDDITTDPMAVLGTLAPEDQERARANIAGASSKQSQGGTEYTAVRKDGTTLPVLVFTSPIVQDGKPAGLRGIAIDITERKRAEEALRQSEDKFRSLAEQSPNMIFINQNGSVVYVNETCERIMGYGREEVCSPDFDFMCLIAPECRDLVMANFRRHIKGEEVAPYEYTLLTKDGHRIEAILTTALMQIEGGTAIFGTATNITDRKRAEEDRRRMEEQRHLAGRLMAVGQLAAGVAHELNNPLAAVQGFAQLVADRKDLEESVRSDIEVIYNEAKRATKITANLLSFARKHQPEKALISINDVIEKSVELHAYRMRVNNIELVVELEPDLPVTMADFHQLQQVFVNILTNGEQAMTDVHGKGTFRVESQCAGDTIRVVLADDGPGIPEEDLERIFEPFYTTKEEGRGTGLGLDICHGIVEQHGGTLQVRSKLGEGTTFTLELPIISADDVMVEQAESVQGEQS